MILALLAVLALCAYLLFRSMQASGRHWRGTKYMNRWRFFSAVLIVVTVATAFVLGRAFGGC